MPLFGKTEEEKAAEARAEEADSTGKAIVSGERTAISGEVVGIYLFRAAV